MDNRRVRWFAAIDLAANQIAWFFCLLLAAAGHPLWAALICVPVCLLHLYLSATRGQDLVLICLIALAGWLTDALIAQSGWVIYQPDAVADLSRVSALGTSLSAGADISLRNAIAAPVGNVAELPPAWTASLPPMWIAGLWAMFATLLERPLGWLRGRVVLAAALGAIGGVMSWMGGARLGAAQLVAPWAYIAVGLEWALATPLLLAISVRILGRPIGNPRQDGTEII